MPYSHVEMDGSNSTDNDFDNEKTENVCVYEQLDRPAAQGTS